MDLSKSDLGPKRRAFDRLIYLGMALFIGWGLSAWYYNVRVIPAIETNSYLWVEATSDKFHDICTYIYGPPKQP